jgi:hypothetical protein
LLALLVPNMRAMVTIRVLGDWGDKQGQSHEEVSRNGGGALNPAF